MAGLHTNFRALWFGTAAAIPANWTRDTDFDEVYFTGDDVDAAASGGNATHLHELPAHSHTGNVHTHDVDADSSSPATFTHEYGAGTGQWAASPHGHGTSVSNNGTTAWTTQAAFNSSAESSDPPHALAIVIKPDDGNQLVPTGAVTFWEDDADPIRCKFTDGTNNVPDLRGKWIKGADALGDGDATSVLGTVVHTHTSSHDHDEQAHGHAAKNAAAADSIVFAGAIGSGVTSILRDVHSVIQLQNNVASDTTSDDGEMGLGTNYVPYVRLAAIQQLAGDQALHTGMILMWVGDAVDLPDDWLLCDGNDGTIDTVDRQIYVVNTKAEVGDTGNQPPHKHVQEPHGHDPNDATHTHAETDDVGGVKRSAATPAVDVAIHTTKNPHSHTWNISDEALTVVNETIDDADLVDGHMPWVGAVFAKYEPVVTTSILGEVSILGTASIAAG